MTPQYRKDAHEFVFKDGYPTLDGKKLVTKSITYNQTATEQGVATVTVELYIKPCSITPCNTELPEVE